MLLTHASLPKISCLLVTSPGRTDCLRRSVHCYLHQTYPNRELVVVNEGPAAYQEEIKALLGDRADVRYIFLDGYYSLGSLRNISIGLAQGELIAQWDDDDYNAPERLAVQYAFLKKHPRAIACYFSDQLHYYAPTSELFWNDWSAFHSGNRKEYSLIPGTIMAYRNQLSARYPPGGAHCRAGEDSVMAWGLLEDEDSVVLFNGQGYLHMYSYHGRNVWDYEHHRKISQERGVCRDQILHHRHRIVATLRFLDLPSPIRVIGREGLAFIYGGDEC